MLGCVCVCANTGVKLTYDFSMEFLPKARETKKAGTQHKNKKTSFCFIESPVCDGKEK